MAASLLLGCGPAVSTDEAAGGTQGEPENPPPDPEAMSEATTGGDDAASEPHGSTGEPPQPDPPTLCNVDPYARGPRITPYYECIRGLVDFTTGLEPSGRTFQGAYAQFFTVYAEEDLVYDEEILDPYDGTIGDCDLRRVGNSAFGEPADILWEDAGDVTFQFGDTPVSANEDGDPKSVLGYDAPLDDYELVADPLDPVGLTASGDTTPPLELSGVVNLPEIIEVVAPAWFEPFTLDAEDFRLEWVPSALALPMEIRLRVTVQGDWNYELFCRVPDTGSFVVPAELVQQIPRPTEGSLELQRADMVVAPSPDGRSILATARSFTWSRFMLE